MTVSEIGNLMPVTVVTVTHGKRWNLLDQTLRAALDYGAERVIVVDNAAEDEIGPKVAAAFPSCAEIVRLEENRGSAGGYCAALRRALAAGAEYLLLLDDDNKVEPDTITALKFAWRELAKATPFDRLCVVGFRPDFMPDLLEGRPLKETERGADAFFGFNVRDLPQKLWKWMPGRRRSTNGGFSESVPPAQVYSKLNKAPFGGMFFHRSVIERFGLPDARLVLYHDDHEFCWRIVSGGGQVVVVPQARIVDLQRSWGISKKKTSFGKIVDLGSDRQVYYHTRNLAWFETHCHKPARLRAINRAVWLCAVWALARARNRTDRYTLILRAIRDGENAHLGINREFPPDK